MVGDDDIILWKSSGQGGFSFFAVGLVESLVGDFNNDDVVNALDIDVMRNAVINMTSDSDFNVDGLSDPNIPDADDFDHLVVNIIGSGRGDGDLSLNINFDHFVILSNNFNNAGTNWDQGNYNIDSMTNFDDFVELSNRFNQNCPCPADGAANIPEPASALLMVMGMLVFSWGRFPTCQCFVVRACPAARLSSPKSCTTRKQAGSLHHNSSQPVLLHDAARFARNHEFLARPYHQNPSA